jgi:hypothetical protein
VRAPPFTVIVNSSDAYADCWGPFFTLFREYWPECSARILLNTEHAAFAFEGCALEATRVEALAGRRLTWSECLMACLDQVRTPVVLYLQEDYFLDAPVRAAEIGEFAGRMAEQPGVPHIGLTNFGACGPFAPTDDPRLWEIARRSRYRISCQAALWNVEVLRSYLRPGENGWMFEIYGTQRARRRTERFLTVDRTRNAAHPILPYSHAGIVKGQWHRSVPALFARHGIVVDYARRGFFTPRPPLLEKVRTMRKLLEHPAQFVRGMSGL